MRNRTLKEIQEDIRTLTRVPSEFIHAKLDELAKEIEELVDKQWIPCSEDLPKTGECVLVSFENDRITLPDIATYETDQQGNGTFRSSDGNIPYASIGIYVNAWMSLPKPYKGE